MNPSDFSLRQLQDVLSGLMGKSCKPKSKAIAIEKIALAAGDYGATMEQVERASHGPGEVCDMLNQIMGQDGARDYPVTNQLAVSQEPTTPSLARRIADRMFPALLSSTSLRPIRWMTG